MRRDTKRMPDRLGVSDNETFINEGLNVTNHCRVKPFCDTIKSRQVCGNGLPGIENKSVGIRVVQRKIKKGLADVSSVLTRIATQIKGALKLITEAVQGTCPDCSEDLVFISKIAICSRLAVTQNVSDLSHGNASHSMLRKQSFGRLNQARSKCIDFVVSELFSHTLFLARDRLQVRWIVFTSHRIFTLR